MRKIRVGITGASGFIGRKLMTHFIEQGHSVKVISRSSNKFFNHELLNVFETDLTDPSPTLLKAFVEKVDVVYHLAAELNDPSKILKTNVEGTQAIVDALEGTNTLLIHLSSIGVFDFSTTEVIHENSQKKTFNLYEESKLKAEMVIDNGRNSGGLKAVVLRPSIVLGNEMKSQLIKQLIRLLNSGIHLKISEKVIANFVLADDVVDALIFLASDKNAIGESYNFSNDISLATFLTLIRNHLPSQRKISFSGKIFTKFLWVGKWIGFLNISYDGIRFFSNRKKIPTDKIEQLGFQFNTNYSSFLKEYLTTYK